MKCCICKKEIDVQIWQNPGMPKATWDTGHNAEPIKKGRCCTKCNDSVVLEARLRASIGRK